MEAKIVLDTTILIDFLRNTEYAISKIEKLSQDNELFTTDINIFELYYGAYIAKDSLENVASIKGLIDTLTILNTDADSMEIAGKLLAELAKKGNLIEFRDALIAGICLKNSLPIITANKKDFEKTGVKIIEA